MTSLNPLHTIEKQLAEVLAPHKGLWRQGQRENSRTARAGRHPRASQAPESPSTRTLRRPAAAGDDRHGPGLRAATADRRRTDHRARRHRPVEDPRSAQDLQARLGMSLLLITHDLNLVRRIAHRVCVMQQGRIVEQASCQELFAAPRHPIPASCSTPSPAVRRQATRPVKPCWRWTTCGSGSRSAKACSAAPWTTSRRSTGQFRTTPRADAGHRWRKRLGQVDPWPGNPAAAGKPGRHPLRRHPAGRSRAT